MALLNFKSASEDKLRGILGSYNTEEDRARLRFSDSYVEKNYYKVTQIIQGTVVGSEETYTEYKAIQVNPDGTEVQNGIVFDSDQTYTSNVNSPLYLPNLKINEELFTGAVELGKAYQVEEIDPEDFSGGLEPVYYIIPKGGGGGGDVRLLMNGTALEKGVPFENGASIVGYDNTVITSGVTIVQNVFDTANIYSGEILYAYINEDGNYALDKALLGV